MKKQAFLMAVLLLLSILALTSCDQEEWPIGRDTDAAWKQGKIQIVRTSDRSYDLHVDHRIAVGDIRTYCSDGSYIYLVRSNRRVFVRFSLEDETYETYFGLDRITDERTLGIFSDLMSELERQQ